MEKTIKEIVKELEKTMQCNCDLDRWEPERKTGHSWVCRIHEAAMRRYYHPSLQKRKEYRSGNP